MIVETCSRSIAKAVSWRALATLATVLIVYLFTGRLDLAAAVGLTEALAKTALYFVHERVWNKSMFGRRRIDPAVIWFTGLSGSGKTVLAKRVFKELESRGLKAEYLDGDAVRDLFPNTGFSKAERDMHIRRVGHLASRLEKSGVFVVASFISPYAETRGFVRELCESFVEVYVSTPLEVCEARDAKGLYAKARRGEIKNFTGIDDPYEAPKNAELTIDTNASGPDEAVGKILGLIDRGVPAQAARERA